MYCNTLTAHSYSQCEQEQQWAECMWRAVGRGRKLGGIEWQGHQMGGEEAFTGNHPHLRLSFTVRRLGKLNVDMEETN